MRGGGASKASDGGEKKNSLENLQTAYNLINLPRSISNSNDGNVVRYSYLSDGCKYRAIDNTGDGFLYTGSLR